MRGSGWALPGIDIPGLQPDARETSAPPSSEVANEDCGGRDVVVRKLTQPSSIIPG